MFILFLGIISYSLSNAQSSKDKVYNVAIFIHQGVELLDFAGPGEAFAATSGFKVYTVASSTEPIISQRFVKITPEYNLDNCPQPDIIVLPGGATNIPLRDEKVIHWIKKASEKTEIMMSVCTGAFLLNKAGLLNGKEATTHYGSVDQLEGQNPDIVIHRKTRFVDNGNVLTTAGVSAGIDGALHVISRLKGEEVATATAEYMEYDKWQPKDGKIIESEILKILRTEGAKKAIELLNKSPEKYPLYEGELKNSGAELLKEGKTNEAITWLEYSIKKFPNASSYASLGNAYRKTGKHAPMDEKAFMELVEKNPSEALKALEKIRKEFPGWLVFNENRMNRQGYKLMREGKNEEAIILFQMNVMAYPQSFNTYDSLGEAYMEAGKNDLSIKNYKKSLELNPENTNAENKITELQKL